MFSDNRNSWLWPLTGLAAGLPIAFAIVATSTLHHNSPHPVAVTPAPTVTVTETQTETSSPVETPTPAETPSSFNTPAAAPTVQPEGTLAIADWHDKGNSADGTCVTVQIVYENRSNTAIDAVSQNFQTLYTPQHAPNTYPGEVNGPTKTLTQQVGVAAFQQRTTYWEVCAPELASVKSGMDPNGNGTDTYEGDIGAQPQGATWTWFSS